MDVNASYNNWVEQYDSNFGKIKNILAILMSCLFTSVYCQSNTDALVSKTKAVFGLGFPELLHAGIGFDLGNSNQLGLSVGFLPETLNQ